MFLPKTSPIFFFTKRLNLLKLRAAYTTQVLQPRQAILSNFWLKRKAFGTFIPLFSWEKVDNEREENCAFFENFAATFPEKRFKVGIFNKRGIIRLPRIKQIRICDAPCANGNFC